VAGDAAHRPPAGRWSGHDRRTISRSGPQHFDGWIELAERDDQAAGGRLYMEAEYLISPARST